MPERPFTDEEERATLAKAKKGFFVRDCFGGRSIWVGSDELPMMVGWTSFTVAPERCEASPDA
jgi:hypothetical protein